MRNLIIICALLLLSPLAAFASLDDFITSLNVQARADLPGFSVKVGAQFGVPVPQVQAVIQAVHEPADAFMVFQLCRFSGKQPEKVMGVYDRNRGKGWGVIARELGIKPGSSEFHALKNGNLHFTGAPAASDDSPGKGRGKGRGHNR